ncbi:Rha family transcriptional regulator [Listeria booriae]|uniref:Rha family transcriptional regulator n=1 Tax=Listeria booriae TaxID=1552123 RepID=UPI00163DE3EE|nr:Rha family transcriptional regulator [Listeria booriae]MBC1306863.1 Rha family transcriptional regulator [Listeria booriae]
MNQTTTQNTELLIDSREVAEMIGKRHADLLRDIETYVTYIGQNAELRSDDFFTESSYQAGTGKPYKCYNLTKMGCEMVANKLTGAKGVQFTAAYVKRFNELEKKTLTFFIPATYSEALSLAAEQARENEQLKLTVAENQPKVDYCEQILNASSLATVSQIAKDYGYSAQAFNRLLHELEIQFNKSGTWLLYQAFAKEGYTQTRTKQIGEDVAKIYTCWTQEGRLFLYHKLKEHGILPKIEQKSEVVNHD